MSAGELILYYVVTSETKVRVAYPSTGPQVVSVVMYRPARSGLTVGGPASEIKATPKITDPNVRRTIPITIMSSENAVKKYIQPYQ